MFRLNTLIGRETTVILNGSATHTTSDEELNLRRFFRGRLRHIVEKEGPVLISSFSIDGDPLYRHGADKRIFDVSVEYSPLSEISREFYKIDGDVRSVSMKCSVESGESGWGRYTYLLEGL